MTILWLVPARMTSGGGEEGMWLRAPAGAGELFAGLVAELRTPGIWAALWQPDPEPCGPGRLMALLRTRPRWPGLAEAALAGWAPPSEPVGRLRRLVGRPLELAPLLAAELAAAEAERLLDRLEAGLPVRLDGVFEGLRRRLGQELALLAGTAPATGGRAGTGGGIRTPDIDGVSVAL
ncbi:MAG: hypothetical protein RMK81_14400, partial [Geminicoccaceae bacterium]|nr:hypothetical protein [Geminicoccaceae bacterium]